MGRLWCLSRVATSTMHSKKARWSSQSVWNERKKQWPFNKHVCVHVHPTCTCIYINACMYMYIKACSSPRWTEQWSFYEYVCVHTTCTCTSMHVCTCIYIKACSSPRWNTMWHRHLSPDNAVLMNEQAHVPCHWGRWSCEREWPPWLSEDQRTHTAGLHCASRMTSSQKNPGKFQISMYINL